RSIAGCGEDVSHPHNLRFCSLFRKPLEMVSVPMNLRMVAACAGIIALASVSLIIGVYSVTLADMVSGRADIHATMVMLVSRIPRTVAIMLVGVSTSIAGMIMQLLARNRFVSPS